MTPDTRPLPGRIDQGTRWVLEVASRRMDAEFELIDLRDYPLPHLDEPLPPSMRQYQNEHTRQWADEIASLDGFVMVTPEYNHNTLGVLKTPSTTSTPSETTRPVRFVSYGSVGAPARPSTYT